MLERFKSFCQQHHLLEHGDSVVVGVSGGADSVCLLHLLDLLRKEWELTIHVFHLHHGIRGQEADRDAEFVRKISKEWGFPCEIEYASIPEKAVQMGMSEEEAGRVLRYERLESYRREHSLKKIATAHHRDDQAETVLFRLFRGTGARGLAGIPVKRDCIIRPLLFAGRGEIEDFLRKNDIRWQEDSTNHEMLYARNRIRHELLPLAEREVNERAGRHIAEAAQKISEWAEFIDKMSNSLFERAAVIRENEILLSLDELKEQDIVLRKEVMRLALEKLDCGVRDVGQRHYEEMAALIVGDTGKRICLPAQIIIEKSYDKIIFYRKKCVPREEVVPFLCKNFSDGGEAEDFISISIELDKGEECQYMAEDCDGNWIFEFTIKKRGDLPDKIPQKDYTKWLNYDKINNSLVLRNACQGDYFMTAQGHRKKLSRYFIDAKIARRDRCRQLVVAEGKHILWAVPNRISEAYKISEDTQKVLVITRERIQL